MDELLSQLENDERREIMGVGFTSFVMNLVGVDRDGNVMGARETMSYACSSKNVAQQVHALQRFVLLTVGALEKDTIVGSHVASLLDLASLWTLTSYSF